jgi:hypothetical protein
VVLTNIASTTIDTAQADEFVLPNNPTAGSPNVIVLRTSTFPLPREDETITLFAPAFVQATGGVGYLVEREDGTDVCTVVAVGGGVGTETPITVQFRFESGVWRLGPNSGGYQWYNNIAMTYTNIGVVAGVGA